MVLPGLLATLGLSGNSKGIEIYGPSELRSFINSALKIVFANYRSHYILWKLKILHQEIKSYLKTANKSKLHLS